MTVNVELRRSIIQNEDVKPTLHSIEMLRAEHVNVLRACAEGEAMARSLLRSEKVGRAYERFALAATSLGVRNAFVNQPVEVPAWTGACTSFASEASLCFDSTC